MMLARVRTAPRRQRSLRTLEDCHGRPVRHRLARNHAFLRTDERRPEKRQYGKKSGRLARYRAVVFAIRDRKEPVAGSPSARVLCASDFLWLFGHMIAGMPGGCLGMQAESRNKVTVLRASLGSFCRLSLRVVIRARTSEDRRPSGGQRSAFRRVGFDRGPSAELPAGVADFCRPQVCPHDASALAT